MYIQASSGISAQAGFRQESFLPALADLSGPRIQLQEPDYSRFIDPKLIRRMSRIIRMGVATAMDALEQAGLSNPDAILTGTAYGCLDDTGVFLRKMVEHQEEMLTPTAFIQSTHNTVGAQIALMLKCHSYNNTYVQRQFSFESALLDAWLLLNENPAAKLLVGAADELTAYSFDILQRFGLFRQLPAGEGAAFFVLAKEKREISLASIKGVYCFHATDELALKKQLLRIQSETGTMPGLLLSGAAEPWIVPGTPVFNYKELCGEYPTASAFACWLGAGLLHSGKIPAWLPGLQEPPASIWVYQADGKGNHSIIALLAC